VPYVLNVLYGVAIAVLSPWLIWRAIFTGRYRSGLASKWFGSVTLPPRTKPRIWLHAVSVGEVLLLRPLLHRLRQQYPGWECVLSVTTHTGMAVARRTYPELQVFYYPLDFTWAVRRALGAVDPQLIVLAELELWPNFLLAADRRGVPVVVVNGRMSPRSHRRYRLFRPLLAPILDRVARFIVQTETYAQRFREAGVAPGKIVVSGSLKFDGVMSDRSNFKTQQLARLFGLEDSTDRPLVWVVGSTQEPEERWALEIYSQARRQFPRLRLIIVPRHQERFDGVAQLITRSGYPLARRSELANQPPPTEAVILIDTLGELGAAWGLADLAFVGGSFGRRGGQNMIEPAAYGVAVTFGPNVWNFRDVVQQLLEARAAVQVPSRAAWEACTLELLGNTNQRRYLGEAAQQLALAQQGATDRTLAALAPWLHRPAARSAA
jgi:3-deoxy-D-manno-octulosonic-acid transferase